jgi:dUTP pyrophosphatase
VEKLKVKIKFLSEETTLPFYATIGSAGFDLAASRDTLISPGKTKIVHTDIAISVPDGYELQVRPRSGVSLKTPLRVANTPGTLDSDYLGECCVIMTYMPNLEFDSKKCGFQVLEGGEILIKKGDRIAQGVLSPVVQAEFDIVEDLGHTDRGTGGFGSTGMKA